MFLVGASPESKQLRVAELGGPVTAINKRAIIVLFTCLATAPLKLPSLFSPDHLDYQDTSELLRQ